VPLYELTEGADADIQAVARYTISMWGIEQARRYEALLEKHLQAIGRQKARTHVFLNHVSGQSKPASDGQLKTGHLEGRIALCAADVAQGRDEQTQREPATFDNNVMEQRVVLSSDRS
jgi:hypothetical protein